ncbi:hypothetical protein ACFL2P_02315 [Candidatus Moduliflexota bacterium]
MTKEFGKAVLVAVIVLSFAAAPFAGALCTMSCADSGSSCCCTAGVPGEVSLKKVSCCEGEVAGTSGAGAEAIMAADRGRTVLPSIALSRVEAVASLYDGRHVGITLPLEEELSARSSPIFLLTESFLI